MTSNISDRRRPTTQPSARKGAPGAIFRDAIERAEAAGVSAEEMRLRLTRRDASLLKRDKAIAVSEISFLDGAMRYLGVAVEEGGVDQSELVLPS